MPPGSLPSITSRWSAVERGARALALVAVVIAVYANSLPAPFLFDDLAAVSNNPTIRDLLSLDVLRPPADGSTTTGRPLVNLTLALNYAVGGENPTGYRTVNVALHALAALALMGVVRRTLMRTGTVSERTGSRLALAVALVWAVHPLQTETVVTIAQRTELLCGLLLLVTLYAFVRGWLLAAVVCCLAGMASKEVMVVAPILVLLYDRTFVAGSFRAAWRLRAPFYTALAATWLLLLWLVVGGGGTRGIAAGFGLGVTPWTYLLTQAEALVMYLRLALWPHPLVLDYGTAVVASPGDVAASGLLVIALLAVTVWAIVRRQRAGFLGAVFFLILAPSSSVVPLVTQTMAEHRMYVPLAAVVVALVLAAQRVVSRHGAWWCGGVVLALAATTIVRNEEYLDPVAIWRDTVVKRPENARAQNNLGWALQERGRLDEAARHYSQAAALQPAYVPARYNWGVALLEQQRNADAAEQLAEAVRLAPAHVDARVNLGIALLRLGKAAEAIAEFERALALRPDAQVHYNLGVAWVQRGDEAKAAGEFRSALQLDERLAEAHFQLGRIAERRGERSEAETHFTRTLAMAPEHAGARTRLGLLCARADRLEEAAAHFRAALRAQPDDAEVHANLGNVLLLQNQPRAALESYERALRLRPNDARLRENIELAREALR